MAESFVHLHNHTEYSMLDGAARVEEMVLAAKADGQTAIGITDHGNLYGVIDFYEACRKHGLTPIIGLEAYMAANSRFDRPPRRGKIDDTGGETEGGQKLYHHLTLLAESICANSPPKPFSKGITTSPAWTGSCLSDTPRG